MRKITFIIIAISALAGTSAIMKEDGRAGATGSPGETTCNTSQCHTGNVVNSGGGSIVIAAPTMPGWQYIPGQVYPISVTVSKTGVQLFGLGFEALRASGANGGTLSITSPAQTQIKSAVVGGNVRTNVVHQQNGGATFNSHTFTFNWTAPVTGVGPITFYSAGNAANYNGSASGDFIYTSSQIVTENTSGVETVKGLRSANVYPNPANGRFNIGFELTEPAMVQINITDMNGKIHANVISEPLPAGQHDLYHEAASSLPAGLYFIQLTVDNQNLLKRIVIL